MNSIIICEGHTDGILISYGLIKLSGYEYVRASIVQKEANLSFTQIDINWYRKKGDYIGIVYAGGNDFTAVMSQIIERNRFQFDIFKILIITDHDDITAENGRLQNIRDIINNISCNDFFLLDIGKWNYIDVIDELKQKNQMAFYYMLIPEQDFGAMETFVIKEIMKKGIDEEIAANQTDFFVDNFRSDKFLRKRRERIKAKLSVLLSVISPDRTFTTIDEYLKSVNWSEFEGYMDTFKPILDI